MSTTRNVCVIAHVDHGKTTFSDSLIASNGIISNRLAGTLRYMDSREDEQDRGITMKSSSISLSFQPSSTEPTTDDASAPPPIPVNLIDSPGHVDFGSEVSAAVRLSDCALVLVDAVEGVCVQTHAVLRQAWLERVTPMLVLNKIDRLIAELQLSPLEAWEHIKKIIQEVNAIGGHLFAGAVLEADAAGAPSAAPLPGRDGQAQGDPGEATEVQSLEQLQEAVGSREMQFAPEKGNVLFASAIHGWAFDLRVFAQLFARKLGVREPLLQRVAGRQVGTAPAPGSSAPYALFYLGICLSVATPDPPPPLLIWPG
jgi:ribosome assembly protein 1